MNDCNDSSLRIFYHSICNHILQYKLNLSPPSLALCKLPCSYQVYPYPSIPVFYKSFQKKLKLPI